MEGKICGSCKLKIVNDAGSVAFKCPNCNNYEIVRCAHCRNTAAKYTCPNCSFIGPN